LFAATKFLSTLVNQDHDLAETNGGSSESLLVRRGIAVDFEDDAGDPGRAATNAAAFVDEGVVAVFGSLTSALILPMAEITFASRTPQLEPYGGGPLLGPSQPAQGDPAHPEGRYLFQGITTVAKGSASAMALAIAKDTCRHVVVIVSDDQGAYYDALVDLVPRGSQSSAS
jgi:ABC-type branched-subunit amino acid transport system substrate-binding protein